MMVQTMKSEWGNAASREMVAHTRIAVKTIIVFQTGQQILNEEISQMDINL